MSQEELQRFYENIKTHVAELVTPDMRKHAFASENHDLDFQVFRLLYGYSEALEEIDALRKQLDIKA